MQIYSFEAIGFSGQLVKVEVDIRRGIPAVDIVGLADGAIKEARERIRAGLRNSAYDFPLERILINLAPAGLKKGGASFDLAIALAILVASGQLPDLPISVLAMGELELSGQVRAVCGVLPAVAEAMAAGIDACVVPLPNVREAAALAGDKAWALVSVRDALPWTAGLLGSEAAEAYRTSMKDQLVLPVSRGGVDTYSAAFSGMGFAATVETDHGETAFPDFSDVRGQPRLRRAMEVAAAGGHHVLLFGPPGSGKTMAAQRLPGLLPDMDEAQAIETTKIHSLAGVLPADSGLLRKPVFRAPHHGASAEGIVGGGRALKPGEISLAHGGVLFLDETPEFRSDVLQALREPLESGRISIARAERVVQYPSRFVLVLACNPCPCGNLGRSSAVCLCSGDEIRRYWKRLGAPLLDRIDLRIPVKSCSLQELSGLKPEGSDSIRQRVTVARLIQARRYAAGSSVLNGNLPVAALEPYCAAATVRFPGFRDRIETAGLSTRAWHSIVRVARTIADLAQAEHVQATHLEEAYELRRYGDEDWFWQLP